MRGRKYSKSLVAHAWRDSVTLQCRPAYPSEYPLPRGERRLIAGALTVEALPGVTCLASLGSDWPELPQKRAQLVSGGHGRCKGKPLDCRGRKVEDGMFFELRSYPVFPGKMEAWVKFMEEAIIPFQLSKGMCILGSFVDEENYRYVWIRRFADEAERDRQYAAVYNNDFWRDDVSPRVGELLDRDGIEVSILRATPRSFQQ